MATEDSQLLALCARNRFGREFDALVERHIDFVYAAALRQTGDATIAEDVTQAVFLLLCRRLERLKPGTLVKGWLFNVTRYVVANARRAEARRKSHEREAAKMRPETILEDHWPSIAVRLDDALAELSEKDRRILLLRFFDDLPMASLGRTLGISEEAAQKRISRALERLRYFLVGRGAAVISTALGGALQVHARQAAPSHLAKMTIDLALNGAPGAARSGSVFSLAKGTAKMMIRARAKLLAISALIVGLLIGGVVELAASQSRLAPEPSSSAAAIAEGTPAGANQGSNGSYNACYQVLKSIVDGYDRNDADAVKSLFYNRRGTDPQTIDDMNRFLDSDVAAYHLAKSAIDRFGMHGTALNIGLVSTNAVFIMDVLPRLNPQSARVTPDTVTIKPAPSAGPYEGCWQSPIYFVCDQGVWKLDAARNFRLEFHAIRRRPIPGETPQQACAASIQLIVDRFNAIADDIDKGKITDDAEVRNRINSVFREVNSQFSECNFAANH